jgi:hypothetical protein
VDRNCALQIVIFLEKLRIFPHKSEQRQMLVQGKSDQWFVAAPFLRINALLPWDLWFIFNLWIKKIRFSYL